MAKTFPNPLCVAFGYGKVLVHCFKDENGFGVFFAEAEGEHEVGELAPEKQFDEPHVPQEGEIYLHFANVEAAEVVIDMIRKAAEQA